MNKRKALQQNTELRFTNHEGGNVGYIINSVIGFGGSCIVYDGYYINNAGSKNTVRIKECYPYKLHIDRGEMGELIIPHNESEKFAEYKERVRASFKVANELHEASGLTNLTSNVFDIYEANETVYIVSSYVEGNVLSSFTLDSLKDAVRTATTIAKCIEKLHNQGYLYLDLKPENIFVYREIQDLIQLFDFDSVIPIEITEKITEYKLSYSPGFAPLEQKMGKIAKIGKHTDIYSVGALFFYMIFGRAPEVLESGFDAKLDYSRLIWNEIFQDRLYRELTIFFNHTLQPYYKDRYQDMGEAILQLQEIEKYASMAVPFICSSHVMNSGMVVGRDKECAKLLNWYEGDKPLMFITGMGGIGKSTIVRKFINDNRDMFDNIIYVEYKETLCETIADDTWFCINGYEKDEVETTKEYFARKIKAAKELAHQSSTLLVIDNFEGAMDEYFNELLNVHWKIIVISRCDMSSFGHTYQVIEPLDNENDMCLLFENQLGRKLNALDCKKLHKMIELSAGNILVMMLIARQMSKSFLNMDEALTLLIDNGFSHMAGEKVDYVKDGQKFYDTISSIIKATYNVASLSSEKKKCMKILSLFDNLGVVVGETKQLLKLETYDEINELRDLGWLEIQNGVIGMHPLIQETMHQLDWIDEYRDIAMCKMYKLCIDINENDILKYKNRRNALDVAKSFLRHCGKDDKLSKQNMYKELMFATLMNLPKEQEEYIICNAEKMLKDTGYMKPHMTIELCDYVVYLLCQKESYEEAREYLKYAYSFAKKCNDSYIWGLYYDMLSDFYDTLLNGAYYSVDEDENALFRKLLDSMDKAIENMDKAIRLADKENKNTDKVERKIGKMVHDIKIADQEKANKLYVKYVLGKATLMIRNMPEKSRKIRAMIAETKNIIKEHTIPYAEPRFIYYMVLAWYHTLCEPDKRAVLHYLQKASNINIRRGVSALDDVDFFYIPAANMMWELGDIKRAIEWLEASFTICDTHKDMVPYIRKKLGLLEYELDVYCSEEDIEGCKVVLSKIASVNQEAMEFGICKVVSDELLREIEGIEGIE